MNFTTIYNSMFFNDYSYMTLGYAVFLIGATLWERYRIYLELALRSAFVKYKNGDVILEDDGQLDDELKQKYEDL